MFWLETAPTTSRPSASSLTTSTDTSLKWMGMMPGETTFGCLSFRNSSSCLPLLWKSVLCQLVEEIRDDVNTTGKRIHPTWQGKVSQSFDKLPLIESLFSRIDKTRTKRQRELEARAPMLKIDLEIHKRYWGHNSYDRNANVFLILDATVYWWTESESQPLYWPKCPKENTLDNVLRHHEAHH